MQKIVSIITIALILIMPIQIAVAQGKPDLSIEDDQIRKNDITFSDDTPETGQEVIINATIHNDLATSLEDAKNVKVRFNDTYRVGGEQITDIIGEKTISLIKKGESNTTSIKWIPQVAGGHKITVIIDPENKIDENREDNNEADDYIFVSLSTSLQVTIELSKGKSGKIGKYYPNEEMWVNGTVKWSSGSPVRDAEVKITIVDTNTTWNTTTDENGVYEQNMSAPEKPKRYNLTVNATTRGGQSKENSTTFRVLSSPYASLEILSIEIPSRVIVGDRIKITVGISNKEGTGDAEEVEVVFLIENKTIKNETIKIIPKGKTVYPFIEWVAEIGKKTIRVEVWYNDKLVGSINRTIVVEEYLPPLNPIDLTTIFIVGIVILIIALSLLILKRRKKKS